MSYADLPPDSLWQPVPTGKPFCELYEQLDLRVVYKECPDGGEWIWPGRIPCAKLTLLVGFAGVGKSFVAMDIAARLTGGRPWPEHDPGDDSIDPAEHLSFTPSRDPPSAFPEHGRALVISHEDHCGDTIGWRVWLSGGNIENVAVVCQIMTAGSPLEGEAGATVDRAFSLDRDLHHLDNLLHEWRGTKLIVIDPLLAHCDRPETETYLRGMLTKLAQLAADWGVAVLGIVHLRRDPAGIDLCRALGSRALATAPRAIWAVQADPADRDRRLFLPLKMNVGPRPAGLAFRFAGERIVWEPQPIDRMATELPPERDEPRRILNEAVAFLKATLAEEDRPAGDVLARAKKCGFTWRTIERAKAELNVRSHRKGFGQAGNWHWSLARPNARATDRTTDTNG